MCGLTKLGTNAVTIKKETIYVYVTHPFWLSLSRSHIG